MAKVKVTGVVKYGGVWHKPGDTIEKVPSDIAEQMVSQDVGTMIEDNEDSEAEKSAKLSEKELKSLRKKAEKLGIEGTADMDAETLTAEIAAKENPPKE